MKTSDVMGAIAAFGAARTPVQYRAAMQRAEGLDPMVQLAMVDTILEARGRCMPRRGRR